MSAKFACDRVRRVAGAVPTWRELAETHSQAADGPTSHAAAYRRDEPLLLSDGVLFRGRGPGSQRVCPSACGAAGHTDGVQPSLGREKNPQRSTAYRHNSCFSAQWKESPGRRLSTSSSHGPFDRMHRRIPLARASMQRSLAQLRGMLGNRAEYECVLRGSPLRGARNLAGQRECHVFQRLVGVAPRSVDVAMSQGALHVGHRHASA